MSWTLPVFLATAFAAQSVPAGAPASPLLGRWSLDMETTPFPPAARPKNVVMILSDAGGGKWTTGIDIVAPDGARLHASGTIPLDGTPASIEGSIEADHVSFTVPAPNMLIIGLSKAGTPGTTRIYTVSPDGRTATETHVYLGPGGRLAQRAVTWRRIP